MKTVFRAMTAIGLTLLATAAMARADWPMPGHDVQRTSWAREDVATGICNKPGWSTWISAYIPSRAHIITSAKENLVYCPAADGIHALDPADGKVKWVYAMELPPGDSPAIVNGVMYVCGTDKTIHAVDAKTGRKIWQTARAGAAYYNSPVVVGDRVYSGALDGFFYCFNATNGELVWYYEAGFPIYQSAAYQTYPDYPDGVLFFTSRENCAFALNAKDGSLIWKSPEFAVDCFQAWWPVVYQDYVFLVASTHWSSVNEVQRLAKEVMYSSNAEIAANLDSDGWLNVQNHIDFYTKWPFLKTFFVLDRKTGQEAMAAPFIHWHNPHGTRPPPMIGPNPSSTGPRELVWAASSWDGRGTWTEGHFIGWWLGTNKAQTMPDAKKPPFGADQPTGSSVIGNYLYYNHGGGNKMSSGIYSLAGSGGASWSGGDLEKWFPGFTRQWHDRKYGTINRGINGKGYAVDTHGHQPTTSSLGNRVFYHRANSVICMTR